MDVNSTFRFDPIHEAVVIELSYPERPSTFGESMGSKAERVV